MIERGKDRRALPIVGDRRKASEQVGELYWEDTEPTMPGMIRPGVGEVVPAVERRLTPGSGGG